MSHRLPGLDRLPPYVFATVNQIKMQARREAGTSSISNGQPGPRDAAAHRRKARRSRPEATQPPLFGLDGDHKLRLAIAKCTNAASTSTSTRTRRPSSPSASRRACRTSCWSHRPGDVVFTPNPTYPIHPFSAIIAGGDVRGIPVGPGQDFFENLMAAPSKPGRGPKC